MSMCECWVGILNLQGFCQWAHVLLLSLFLSLIYSFSPSYIHSALLTCCVTVTLSMTSVLSAFVHFPPFPVLAPLKSPPCSRVWGLQPFSPGGPSGLQGAPIGHLTVWRDWGCSPVSREWRVLGEGAQVPLEVKPGQFLEIVRVLGKGTQVLRNQ
jgi:hypothetical protein